MLMPNNGETFNYGIVIKNHGIWSITIKICRIHHNMRSTGDTIKYSNTIIQIQIINNTKITSSN